MKENDERIFAFLDNLAMGVSLISPEMEIIWNNRVFRDWFPEVDVKKRPLCYQAFYSPPREKPCGYCPAVKTLKDGKAHTSESDITVDGNVYLVTSAPLKNEKGEVTQIIKTVQNITDLKRKEEKLRESEGKLAAMLGSIGDHISMLDRDLNILWANDVAKKLFGEDIIGKKCYTRYHRRDKPCEPSPCLTLKAFRDGRTHEHDTEVIGKDGKKMHFHCTANVALRDEEGNPTAVIEISRDVTEQKKAEEELKGKLEELERMNKLMVGRELRMAELKKRIEELEKGKR